MQSRNTPQTGARNQLLIITGRVLRIGITAVSLLYIARAILQALGDLGGRPLVASWGFLAGGLTALVAFYVACSLSWQRLISWLEPSWQRPARAELHRIFFSALLARYSPGGTLIAVGGRAGFFQRLGGTWALGLPSILFEQFYLVVGALGLGWLSILLSPASLFPGWLQTGRPMLIAGGALACALFLLVPMQVLGWIARRRQGATPALKYLFLQRKHQVGAFVLFFSVDCLQGVASMLVLWAVNPGLVDRRELWPLLLAIYPLSRAIGQIAAFAPGGLVVREAVFTFLMREFLPSGAAVLSAGLLRLGSVTLEMGLALLFTLWATALSRQPAAKPEGSI